MTLNPISELHKIRENNYEKTKDMTIEEEVNYINSKANSIISDKNKKTKTYKITEKEITVNEQTIKYNTHNKKN